MENIAINYITKKKFNILNKFFSNKKILIIHKKICLNNYLNFFLDILFSKMIINVYNLFAINHILYNIIYKYNKVIHNIDLKNKDL